MVNTFRYCKLLTGCCHFSKKRAHVQLPSLYGYASDQCVSKTIQNVNIMFWLFVLSLWLLFKNYLPEQENMGHFIYYRMKVLLSKCILSE